MDERQEQEMLSLISKLMYEKKFKELHQEIVELHPADLADLFEELAPKDCLILFRLLKKDQAAEVFSHLNSQQRSNLVSALHIRMLEQIVDELNFDDKIDFLEEQPANLVKNLLKSSTPEERELINQFLNYPDNCAGSLMTIEYIDLKKGMNVRQALDHIKSVGMDKETIYTCYVLDDTRHLEGLVSLRQLVLSDEEAAIGDIMEQDMVLCHTLDDQEEVAEQFKKYDLMAIPVVDKEQRLIGIITIDDIVDVIEQENTEDFQKMAAMAPADEEYLHTSVFNLSKKRIAWLLILMISATFTGAIITYYEDLLGAAVALTAFIPMLMDSGGNAGSQSSTLIIRGIATGEIELRDWPKVLWKEFRVSFVVGVMLGIVNFGRLTLFGSTEMLVAATVSLTLVFTIMMAKLVGGVLPMAAKALKLDPAIMAGPLITTVVDALSLVLYFAIAGILLF